MGSAIASSAYEECVRDGAATPASDKYHARQSSHHRSPSMPNHIGGIEMGSTCEPTPRKFRGGRTGNKSRIGTDDLADWLADVLRNKPAKDIADDAGCGIRTAENAKQGRNALSAKHLANMQMNDPAFAAAWAEYVGLILPGDAEFAGALTRAAQAYMRRHTCGGIHEDHPQRSPPRAIWAASNLRWRRGPGLRRSYLVAAVSGCLSQIHRGLAVQVSERYARVERHPHSQEEGRVR